MATSTKVSVPRRAKRVQISSLLASTPMAIVAIGVFVVCVGYSVMLSFTKSRLFP